MESMTNCPYLLPQARAGMRLGHGKVLDSMITDGLWDAYEDFHMGMTGELVAEKYGITRQRQDAFAVESHRRAIDAMKNGRFKDEIVPISIKQKKGDPIQFATDESPRADTSLEALAKLRPAFKPDGTVTAGNAPGTNDGAAALVVTSAEKARELGKTPMARIVGQAVSGVEPKWVMMAPVDAVRMLLKKAGLENRGRGPVRIERGFLRPGHRGDRAVGPRPREDQRERRRRGARPSHRRLRRAHPRDAALRNGPAQRQARRRRAVPRRRERRALGE